MDNREKKQIVKATLIVAGWFSVSVVATLTFIWFLTIRPMHQKAEVDDTRILGLPIPDGSPEILLQGPHGTVWIQTLSIGRICLLVPDNPNQNECASPAEWSRLWRSRSSVGFQP